MACFLPNLWRYTWHMLLHEPNKCGCRHGMQAALRRSARLIETKYIDNFEKQLRRSPRHRCQAHLVRVCAAAVGICLQLGLVTRTFVIECFTSLLVPKL